MHYISNPAIFSSSLCGQLDTKDLLGSVRVSDPCRLLASLPVLDLGKMNSPTSHIGRCHNGTSFPSSFCLTESFSILLSLYAVGTEKFRDQRRRCKDILLTTLVRGYVVDPMQRSCYQSIEIDRDVLMRQEHWRDVWKSAWVRNQGNRTTRHVASGCEHHEMRQKMLATWEDAFTISLRGTKNLSLIKGEDRQFKHDLREALRDARYFREDAAKGIED